MEQILEVLQNNSIFTFTILLAVILTIPPLFERLRLPGLVGLLVAGVVLGPNVLKFLNPDSEILKLFSDIGKIYLMFVAGLEIDLEEFRKKKNRSLGFGIATFLLPLIIGTLVGRIFGLGWNAAILTGSLLASHTLLGYPIVNRLGVVANEAVTVTIGATIFTDIAALLVLAICVAIADGEFSALSLATQLVTLAIYSAAVLFGLDWAGKKYFERTGDEESNQFLFILSAVLMASVGAQVINVDKIVGAFLAGLAVNDVVGRGPIEEKVEFVGSTLFIPFFFVGMGLLLDIPAFVKTITSELGLTLAIVGGLIGSKFLAASVAKLLYRYSWDETLTMWSLSLPQVAATLAAALAGKNSGLLPESVFNTVIVLMLVTSILGPVLTARFGSRLPIPKTLTEPDSKKLAIEPEMLLGGVSVASPQGNSPESPQGNRDFGGKRSHPFTVVVPVYNPYTERYLVEMAALLARHESGRIVPLSVARAHVHMDEPNLALALKYSKQCLDRALDIAQEFQVEADSKVRIDDDVASGISRTAREQNANLIVMGWSENTGFRARLLGNITNNVFWSSHCPVAVMRLLDDPINFHTILVPIKNLQFRAVRTIRFAQLFADTNQASVTFLHVCDRHTPEEQVEQFQSDLSKIIELGPKVTSQIKTIPHEDPARIIIQAAQSFDLVVLRSIRYRTSGGLAVSHVTTSCVEELTCSLVLFGEPHS
ncbi:MAG: universal stress protein [Oscillatoria sp. SIO1A7]|nr:universal stress protein [Oscillatoria sp. SIO1A7]